MNNWETKTTWENEFDKYWFEGYNGSETQGQVKFGEYIKSFIKENFIEKIRVKELLLNADSKLSLLRHRGNIKWESIGLCEASDVDEIIGELRDAYEHI